MTQGFLLGLGIFGGLLVGSWILLTGRLILSNITEIAKIIVFFVGIAVASYLGFAACAVILGTGAFLVLVGWLAAKMAVGWRRRAQGSTRGAPRRHPGSLAA